jgi:hypothetical protein
VVVNVCASGGGIRDHIERTRLTIFNTLLKRLSDGITKSINVTVAEDDGFEKPEEAALERFGEKISQHLVSGAMTDSNVARLNAIFYVDYPITSISCTYFISCTYVLMCFCAVCVFK